MEQTPALPTPTLLAKRLWHVARVVYYMFRKSFAKRKLAVEVHLLFKRSKLAGKKAIWNLISHHHHTVNSNDIKKAFQTLNNAETTVVGRDEVGNIVSPSPLRYRNFGISPMAVRQLRITDSPFPSSHDEEEEGGRSVDVDAEEFIVKFYQQLRREQWMDEIEEIET